MSQLLDILKTELSSRKTAEATAVAYKEEAEKIVKSIHAYFDHYAEVLGKLVLKGKESDERKHLHIGGIYQNSKPKVIFGLQIALNRCVRPEELVLAVEPRTNTNQGPTVTIRIDRRHPYQNSDVQKFNGYTPIEDIMDVFFATLATYVKNIEDLVAVAELPPPVFSAEGKLITITAQDSADGRILAEAYAKEGPMTERLARSFACLYGEKLVFINGKPY